MVFKSEAEFEAKMIAALQNKGWEHEVLKYPTEEKLLKNWAQILFENNRSKDRLNNVPLTDTEMQQILEQVIALRTPVKLNGFINGKTVAIKRDNPEDDLHLGKEVSLKIYDRREIAAGQSRYQIASQPVFKAADRMRHDRRGDLLLLINGMPVIHVELKKNGIPVSRAYEQIGNCANEGIFTGIFSLIQVFVAMQPEETVYFANPGPGGKFNKDFYFHWADFNNEPINHWRDIATYLLSIPMAHQLIGFYTVADESDGILKVMRSYQYFAANAISDRVSKMQWSDKNPRGGYIWHTTGSGKTMTSFKSAQLIANSKDADKVLFLMDRIELGTQSLREYRAFADDNEDVQATENTRALISRLKSDDPSDTLIVTSIQKMSNIKDDGSGSNAEDIAQINSKRIVFIVDEAHRSTFGEMMTTIKRTFPEAVFFGFTGTPILEDIEKKMSTTATIFGDELHRYSIADGIRDKNVLGFDLTQVLTYRDRELREQVALMKAKATSLDDVFADPKKVEVYNHYSDAKKVPMASISETVDGNIITGIEAEVPTAQYDCEKHRVAVVQDIYSNWKRLSQNAMFHAIFATSSIPEAIAYYRLIRDTKPELKVTALFDPTIDNTGDVKYKEEGLIEILEDYNARYHQDFTMVTHAKFKKDVAARLAHKNPYERIEDKSEEQLDILIVVDQMLTGFDSKWVNTLYLDKVLRYEHIIQAFSRTNRIFKSDKKPFGIIRYYRYPHTMKVNIDKAVELYSGNRPLGLFVDNLHHNLKKMNEIVEDIKQIFINADIPDFSKLPEDLSEQGQFAKRFKAFNEHLEAAKIQGFYWGKESYIDPESDEIIEITYDERTYGILVQRYKELGKAEDGEPMPEDVPFDIETYITEIDTGRIDTDYMNSRFEKYLKELNQHNISETQLRATLNELHQSFAGLTQEEQKYANIFLHEVQSGTADLSGGKTFRSYVTEYLYRGKNKQIDDLVTVLGLDKDKLRLLMDAGVTEAKINEYGRFDELKESVDREKAKAYFEDLEKAPVSSFRLSIKIEKLLRAFILQGGFDVFKNERE